MDFQPVMSAQERTQTALLVDAANKKLAGDLNRSYTLPSQNLGKEDFLKILLTQLSHQNPTAPMEDKEFIAQMAQFSSLEQITNMASEFTQMARMVRMSEASGAVGRTVSLSDGDDNVIQGVVEAVTRDEVPMILVNGKYYEWEKVTTLYQ